ncbi:MAG: YggT family protein [Candidatus Daviesbacteria bacterium]|nr:YggT family protein [Candidatus Daviesbacteria bacterium]
MTELDTTTEEVTTVEKASPDQVVTKTTREVEPKAKGEAPQKVYEQKKTIFRFNQIVWYILGLIEVLLVFRIVLKAVGANPSSGFTSLIYALTAPLATPFNGILGASITGNSLIEWSTVIAAIVYLCVAWGFVYLMDLIYPITPRDVEMR